MQLAAAGHAVTSVDSSRSRLERLRSNLERTKLEASLVEADALSFAPERRFGGVLLDAPCSATGTFRRHPEVLYRARPRVIAERVELQSKLIARSALWLEKEGTMIYSVCSLEPEEGERVIAAFLERNEGFRIDPPRGGELPPFVHPRKEGWVRILPGELEGDGGLDGFFIARLVRTA
jgi:16S rRNA (cytosine967-C5)-methyltransferase